MCCSNLGFCFDCICFDLVGISLRVWIESRSSCIRSFIESLWRSAVWKKSFFFCVWIWKLGFYIDAELWETIKWRQGFSVTISLVIKVLLQKWMAGCDINSKAWVNLVVWKKNNYTVNKEILYSSGIWSLDLCHQENVN